MRTTARQHNAYAQCAHIFNRAAGATKDATRKHARRQVAAHVKANREVVRQAAKEVQRAAASQGMF